MKKLVIGFIGNFRVPYTTENDRKWSFEKLGHEVFPLQENEQTYNSLLSFVVNKDPDLIVYSHTHDWNIDKLKEFFAYCKSVKLPTVSVHLDRWAWLERQRDMGQEATWFTEYMFMADFSPEAREQYKKLGINAHYLRPGVVERDCYIAKPDYERFPHEIIFVGSKGYHPEYPFRPKLIDFLKETYGKRFGHYGNDGIGVMRGEDLNTLYATAKIAVGDSCFGGRPYYVSDRYYETRGRGGFLLHPHLEGVDRVGVASYGREKEDSLNLDSLKSVIDYYLENSFEREEKRRMGFHYVKENETYTNRAEEMLNVIFKGV